MILDHPKEHYPLSNKQWSFTEGRGTVTPLVAIIHDWLNNLDQGNDICVIIFDYKKAFDSVPHGPLVLGPLLFMMYVNDLTLLPLAVGSNLSLFADDVILYRPISVPSDYPEIQCDIGAIEHWSDSNHLSLNPQKCKYMIISRRHSPVLPSDKLQLYGQLFVRYLCTSISECCY